ncbi:hypothetical protein PTKIN_Ptkin06aG0191700 [Pterospermum kingtungense]
MQRKIGTISRQTSNFNERNIGKTLVTRSTQGTKGLSIRVIEVSLAELQKDEDQAYRKIRLRAEDVLYGLWFVFLATTDSLRLFCIAFTKRCSNRVKRTCYAQSSQIRQIGRKTRDIMVNQALSCDLKELVAKFIPEVIGREIEKVTSSIYPLQNVFIRKVKILKAHKGKLMEVHGVNIQRKPA